MTDKEILDQQKTKLKKQKSGLLNAFNIKKT